MVVALAAAGTGLWLASGRSPAPRRPPAAPPPSRPRTALPPRPAPRLLLGVDDDTLKWTSHPLTVVRRQRALGARAVRVWVPWQGEARPDAVRRTELARAAVAARHTEVVLAVSGFAQETPLTPRARERFCGYARAVLSVVRHARAVVVWNEANVPTDWRGTPGDYESLLARCYGRLHRLGAVVLDSTASAHSPAAFLRALGAAYRESGRRLPLVDGFGHNPYPKTSAEPPEALHPAGFVGEGDYRQLVAALRAGFVGTAQRSLDVWYLEDGYQSRVPRLLARRYGGHETVATVAAPVQAARLRRAILLAACQPRVRAFFNFELVDEKRLTGWQSGLVWRGAHTKPAARAFAAAARTIGSGALHCRKRP